VADRKHGIPAPSTTSTVHSADWGGRDLSGESHQKVAFVDVDLMETVDNAGVFTECAFRGVRFNVSKHIQAAFVNCTFTRCSFFDATFTNCKLAPICKRKTPASHIKCKEGRSGSQKPGLPTLMRGPPETSG